MRIVLASSSPRRSELLKMMNVPFECIPSEIDEKSLTEESPENIVMGLAFEKAFDICERVEDAIVIGSDTIVYLDEVLGKPSDASEAVEMLKKLSGKTHSVYTGVAVICLEKGIKIIDYVETEVTFNDLSDTVINAYVESGEPLDKAGAYGIQGLGSVLVKSINGDFFSVMGMPLSKLNEILNNAFKINLLTREGL